MPTIEVSHAALAYLKSLAEPFVDTTVSVVDRVVAQLQKKVELSPFQLGQPEMRFGTKDFPSVKFTTVTAAMIAGKPATQKYWNNILEDLVSACVGVGNKPEVVREAMMANTANGKKTDNGYRYVPAAGFSFQGLEGNRVCRNIARLAEKFGVAVDITFRWQENDEAEFPNKVARLVMP